VKPVVGNLLEFVCGPDLRPEVKPVVGNLLEYLGLVCKHLLGRSTPPVLPVAS
jgi:hypothetical protein